MTNSPDWELIPLHGATGRAFMGIRDNEKVFFKRNPSPFITALAAEGFTPKPMWTQRTYSGDILTAQEWKEGRVLSREEMRNPEIIPLIRSIHSSERLKYLLLKIDNKIFQPLDFITLYLYQLPTSLQQHQFFNEVLSYLEDQIDDDFYTVDYVVCHGDLNHHNFLQTEDKLYLVDWDNVHLADPLSDLTHFLCQYFPPSEWSQWFADYRIPQSSSFYKRTKWYSLMNCLFLIKHYYNENQHYRMNEVIILLRSIYYS